MYVVLPSVGHNNIDFALKNRSFYKLLNFEKKKKITSIQTVNRNKNNFHLGQASPYAAYRDQGKIVESRPPRIVSCAFAIYAHTLRLSRLSDEGLIDY